MTLVHEVFRRRAAEHPQATALLHRERTVSYRTLDRASDAYAASLAAAGVRAGDIVPVLMPRSPQCVATLLAVLKLGAAYAALDPRWPPARISELTRQANAPLIAADPAHAPVAGDASGPQVPVWTPATDLAEAAATCPAAPLAPVSVQETDTCCVFFTSGSTGRPKGVLSPHAGTVRLFRPMGPKPVPTTEPKPGPTAEPRPGSTKPPTTGPGPKPGPTAPFADLGPGTVWPQAAPLPWDGACLELWGALLNGGTSVLVDEPYLTADGLRDLVRRAGVNTLWLTASLFHLFVEEDPGCFQGLRQLMVGGERLSPDHVRRFLRAHPRIALVNGYGPVETTVFATTHRISAADVDGAPGAQIPVGRPVGRTEVFVLDEELRPVGPGATGEICVAGAGLARGYLADPEQTARGFAEITAYDGTARRIYRTGDLGFHSADGTLHYAGRRDRQIKVRGHRIEPGEVEARAARVPGVLRCVVVPQMADGGCVGLAAAYTVREDAGQVPEETVREALAGQLPEYLVPRALAAVDAFPLTETGKLDTAALLATVMARTEAVRPRTAAHPPTAPETGPAAGQVAAAFAEILRTAPDEVPRDTSFFELGGTSLDGARLCVRIGARTGFPVPASVLVADPTVDALAHWIEARQKEPAATPGEGAPGEPAHTGPLELLPVQSGFLFEQQLDPAGTSAHCVLLWRVTGDFDPRVFRAAADDVHRRHQSLHARYVFDRRPVAVLDGPPTSVDVHVLDPAPDHAAALAALRATLDLPLDIGAGANWRCAVAPLKGDGWLLGVVVHHIAFDGGSARPLADDLSAAYAARLHDSAPRTTRPVPLAAVLAGHRSQVNEATLEAQHAFWKAELTGLPPLDLPPVEALPDGEAPTLSPAETAPSARFSLPATEYTALEERARRASSTRFAVLLAAYVEALGSQTGQRDLAVGAPVAKRYHPDTADAVGCLIDVVCFRMRPACDGTTGALPRLLEGIQAALAAQDVPFEEVVRLAADPTRDRSRHPLFQTMFALQEAAPGHLVLEGCTTETVREPEPRAVHELEAEVWPDGAGGAEVVLAGRPGRVSAAFLEGLAAAYRSTLRQLTGP
ncbi:AMP-binding protein [Streptomyces sp. NBC_00237]|uniref:AMP-binding protein n=1 Tax=Streptomyces sp. NBC_00237 TaxID=2975687 RepID=UPI00225720BA|nr:AMP-binding protein [Streptomyces sp. NBC_00237]MCX5205886.1 AMP-binding protein [Streptomyces sp. NBC_00237]